MRPVRTEETNFSYKLPGGTEENDLPCVVRDGGTAGLPADTTSFWVVEEADDLDAAQGVYVQVHHPLWGLIAVGFGDRPEGSSLEVRKLLPCEDGGQTNVPLTDEIRAWLRSGGHFVLRIAKHPTPPVSVWLA